LDVVVIIIIIVLLVVPFRPRVHLCRTRAAPASPAIVKVYDGDDIISHKVTRSRERWGGLLVRAIDEQKGKVGHDFTTATTTTTGGRRIRRRHAGSDEMAICVLFRGIFVQTRGLSGIAYSESSTLAHLMRQTRLSGIQNLVFWINELR
jgi:hypothetical protein